MYLKEKSEDVVWFGGLHCGGAHGALALICYLFLRRFGNRDPREG